MSDSQLMILYIAQSGGLININRFLTHQIAQIGNLSQKLQTYVFVRTPSQGLNII